MLTYLYRLNDLNLFNFVECALPPVLAANLFTPLLPDFDDLVVVDGVLDLSHLLPAQFLLLDQLLLVLVLLFLELV